MRSATLPSQSTSSLPVLPATSCTSFSSSVGTSKADLFARPNSGLQAAARVFWGEAAAGFRVVEQLLGEFGRSVIEAERLGWSRQEIREAGGPTREVLAHSVLFARCQQWPRGYAGDFETIETLLNGVNRSEAGTLGWYLEQVALTSAGAEQHRNKLTHQANRVGQTLRRKSDARILALACGGCWEWQTLGAVREGFTGEIVLQDVDGAALELAAQRVATATDRYRYAPGHPFWVAAELARTERFDLITAGGLFDYLTDRMAIRLLSTIFHTLLKPGGALVFANIATGNDWRPVMDYGLNWQIEERSAHELRELCLRAGIPASAVRVSTELSGMTLIVEAVRDVD